jgi:hypothetical protein
VSARPRFALEGGFRHRADLTRRRYHLAGVVVSGGAAELLESGARSARRRRSLPRRVARPCGGNERFAFDGRQRGRSVCDVRPESRGSTVTPTIRTPIDMSPVWGRVECPARCAARAGDHREGAERSPVGRSEPRVGNPSDSLGDGGASWADPVHLRSTVARGTTGSSSTNRRGRGWAWR